MITIKLLLLAICMYQCYVSKKDWLAGMALGLVFVLLLEEIVVK